MKAKSFWGTAIGLLTLAAAVASGQPSRPSPALRATPVYTESEATPPPAFSRRLSVADSSTRKSSDKGAWIGALVGLPVGVFVGSIPRVGCTGTAGRACDASGAQTAMLVIGGVAGATVGALLGSMIGGLLHSSSESRSETTGR